MQMAINVGGLAIMIGTASLLAWYREASAPAKPARPSAGGLGPTSPGVEAA